MHAATPQKRNGDAHHPSEPKRGHQRGVLLVNVGTPDAPDVAAVRRYLVEFLSDPHVIQLPPNMRRFQRPLARFIAWRRGPRSTEKYRAIWTDRGSPLRAIMQDQAAALAERLPDDWSVFIGMRYGQPSIESALHEIARQEIDELVVVPLYPHFSRTTTGTTVDEVYRILKSDALHINVVARTSWNADAGYLNAQSRLIADFATQHSLAPDNAYLLFTAHGLPVSYIERGDPYERQLTQSVRLIQERLGWPADRTSLAYQSRLGPTEWLQPELLGTLRHLASNDERRVILAPVSFAADCLETLEELHIQARTHFEALGGELHVCPSLNTNEHFIQALRELVVRGSRPIITWSRGHKPLLAPKTKAASSANLQLDHMVMVGVSMAGPIGPGQGPELAYTAPETLQCVKKSHAEVKAFLQQLREETGVSEAFVWNTCYRFECYAWFDAKPDHADQQCVIARLRDKLFTHRTADTRTNTLFGRNAWHHLMRTLAGLNSGLPGDKDIVEQFHTAFETAEQTGAAGKRARALVEQAITLAHRVRSETSWGDLDPGYCYAALSRIEPQLPRGFANLRHVVVGSSTTSRSVLHALYEKFGVKEPQVTLIYRAHQGGQMKLLRKAVGHGRRLRVQSYDEPAARAALLDADAIHFGIDRSAPVLTGEMLAGERNLAERPLYVIDFNTAGSTRDLAALPGAHVWTARQLDAEVDRFATELCGRETFPRIVQEAERWIADQAPPLTPLAVELPCEDRDEHGHPNCQRCGRILAPAGETE